jgi:hypothetical protein
MPLASTADSLFNRAELASRIAGLLLSAIAVQLVATAALAFAHQR